LWLAKKVFDNRRLLSSGVTYRGKTTMPNEEEQKRKKIKIISSKRNGSFNRMVFSRYKIQKNLLAVEFF
jgi:hypothetical protein